MIRVCLHGAESTGKSTLARKLAARFACPAVPEYGRTYAEGKKIGVRDGFRALYAITKHNLFG